MKCIHQLFSEDDMVNIQLLSKEDQNRQFRVRVKFLEYGKLINSTLNSWRWKLRRNETEEYEDEYRDYEHINSLHNAKKPGRLIYDKIIQKKYKIPHKQHEK